MAVPGARPTRFAGTWVLVRTDGLRFASVTIRLRPGVGLITVVSPVLFLERGAWKGKGTLSCASR